VVQIRNDNVSPPIKNYVVDESGHVLQQTTTNAGGTPYQNQAYDSGWVADPSYAGAQDDYTTVLNTQQNYFYVLELAAAAGAAAGDITTQDVNLMMHGQFNYLKFAEGMIVTGGDVMVSSKYASKGKFSITETVTDSAAAAAAAYVGGEVADFAGGGFWGDVAGGIAGGVTANTVSQGVNIADHRQTGGFDWGGLAGSAVAGAFSGAAAWAMGGFHAGLSDSSPQFNASFAQLIQNFDWTKLVEESLSNFSSGLLGQTVSNGIDGREGYDWVGLASSSIANGFVTTAENALIVPQAVVDQGPDAVAEYKHLVNDEQMSVQAAAGIVVKNFSTLPLAATPAATASNNSLSLDLYGSGGPSWNTAGPLDAGQNNAPGPGPTGTGTTNQYAAQSGEGPLAIAAQLAPGHSYAAMAYLAATGQISYDATANRWMTYEGQTYAADLSTLSDDQIAQLDRAGRAAVSAESGIDAQRAALAQAQTALAPPPAQASASDTAFFNSAGPANAIADTSGLDINPWQMAAPSAPTTPTALSVLKNGAAGLKDGFLDVTEGAGSYLADQKMAYDTGGLSATVIGQAYNALTGYVSAETTRFNQGGIQATQTYQGLAQAGDFVDYLLTDRTVSEDLQGAQQLTSDAIAGAAHYVQTHDANQIAYDTAHFIGGQVPATVLTAGSGTALKVTGEVAGTVVDALGTGLNAIGDAIVDGRLFGAPVSPLRAQIGAVSLTGELSPINLVPTEAVTASELAVAPTTAGAVEPGIMSAASGVRVAEELSVAEPTAEVAGLLDHEVPPAGMASMEDVAESGETTNTIADTSRAIARSTIGSGSVVEGIGTANVPFSQLSGAAQRLVRAFNVNPGAALGVGSGLPVNALKEASQFLDSELAVLQDSSGNLVARMGLRTSVAPGPGEQFLVHTHPVMNTAPGHLALDIANSGSTIEAVIDWGGNITHFNSGGIIDNPLIGPINDLGYIVGY
jgi:hypothetical protein